MTDDAKLADLDARIDAIDEALDENPERAVELARELVEKHPDEPNALLALAEALGYSGKMDEAREVLLRGVEKDPDDVEARYLLGIVEAELGNAAEAIAQFLEVRRLDQAEDEVTELDWKDVEKIVVAAAEETIKMLPAPFKDRLANVPILLEDRPTEELVKEGVDPRIFGLFEGRTHAEEANNEIAEQPTRIVLYGANLASAFEDDGELAEEVAVTILHEMGHYYGLEEEDMERLGLE